MSKANIAPPTLVRLEGVEQADAVYIGGVRRRDSFRRAERAGHVEGDGWDIDIEGAGAEKAVAKMLGAYFAGHVRAYSDPDVVWRGVGLHVRWSAVSTHRLIVRPPDLPKVRELLPRYPQQRFVLVTGRMPAYEVRGSLDASVALELTEASSWWDNPNGREYAWFVPQESLEPLPVTGSTFPTTIP